MSLRQYRPRRRGSAGFARFIGAIAVALGLTTILLEMVYPLVHGSILQFITIATVYCGAIAMILHSRVAYGAQFALTFTVITLIYSYCVELIGVKSGWPFGTYHYDPTLGPAIAGVPLLVPFAWCMMAYPALVAARRISEKWIFLYGALVVMAWDVFLDPQMVAAGRWHWKLVGPRFPFAPAIPLSNAFGWLFAGLGLFALLHALTPKERLKDGATSVLPNLFLIWALVGGIIGNLYFFHRVGLAFFGGALFALVLAPYSFLLRFGRPE